MSGRSIYAVGPDKARLILSWAEAEVDRCQMRAERSAARLRDLEAREAALLDQIVELSLEA